MKLSTSQNTAQSASIDDRIMPLINIVFLLLIFFLVAGVIKDVEPVEVDPPASIAEIESENSDLTIFIAENGQLALDDDLLDDTIFKTKLTAIITNHPEKSVRIVADKNIDSTKVIDILETLRQAGSSQVKLTTRVKEAP
ncbi:ExbD/TolR family protein [Hirschia baltica]|uniref:Biopolymer transport protein ExbD/TolR n=1 Tax=Hirschia baltica (strain ATCC 49814 / DSM 5838 / IFAM 1418) TaxID=582402 RepID=C6XP29_HIRBI|nr:biopolymer transporter ExbD [Hirschia baltica]ACT60209.1 Biopolymer transport protein ExbD/TolR [Hirschia baltica ATCC 49814]